MWQARMWLIGVLLASLCCGEKDEDEDPDEGSGDTDTDTDTDADADSDADIEVDAYEACVTFTTAAWTMVVDCGSSIPYDPDPATAAAQYCTNDCSCEGKTVLQSELDACVDAVEALSCDELLSGEQDPDFCPWYSNEIECSDPSG